MELYDIIVSSIVVVALFALAYELFIRRLVEQYLEWQQRRKLPLQPRTTLRQSQTIRTDQIQNKLDESSTKKQEEIQEMQRKKAIEELELIKMRSMKAGNVLNPSSTKIYAGDTGSIITQPSTSSSTITRRDKLVLEQDAEYNASLTKDQEKELRNRIIKEREELRKKEEDKVKQAEEAVKVDKEARLKALADSLPQEEADDSPNRCKITVRMPEGDRISRVFAVSNTLRDLFNFIESQGGVKSDLSYEVIALYPRRVYKMSEHRQSDETFANMGIKHGEMIFFQEVVH